MTTRHDGARWVNWTARNKWLLFARKQDGGEMLAQIEERRGGFFWSLGDRLADRPMNEAASLYAAQRAVRRALREVEQNRDREPPRIIARKPCDSCGDPLDNLQGQYVMSGHGRTREVCHKCKPVLEADGYAVVAQAKGM